MLQLRTRLFALFGRAEKIADRKTRDASGRGLKERFIGALGAEFDEQLLPLIDGFLDNCIHPETAMAKFVPYLEQQMGVNFTVSDELAVRRKLVAWAPRLVRIKGTKRSYEVLLKLMGFDSVEIIEHFPVSGFDSTRTLDDDERTFDSGACGCLEYSLLLSGSIVLSEEVKAWIRSVIVWCEPIHARLRDILYNGQVLVYGHLLFTVNADGDLIVDNSAAPLTRAKLSGTGDLSITGTGANRYKRGSGGDLTYS